MTSNGDRYPSPRTPNTQGGNNHGQGDRSDYSIDNPSLGEDYTSSGHADGPVRTNGDGGDPVTSDGFSLNLKARSSEEVTTKGSGGSLPYSSTNEERLANLIDLNNTLVRKVSTLRGDKETLTEKLAQLDEQLRAVRASQALEAQEAVHALEAEKKELVSERNRLEVELQASVSERETLENQAEATRQFIQGLEKSRSALLAEKVALEETNRIFESKAEDALKACEVLRVEHSGVLDERGLQEQRIRKLEMERKALDTEVTEVTSNLSELKRMHDELVKEQLDLERDSFEKNIQYRTEIEEARKIILALETRNDALSQDLKRLEEEKMTAVEAEGAMGRRAAQLDEEKAALADQKLALLNDKRQLELALNESEHQLAVFRSRIQEAEHASTAATLAVTKLEQELEGLHHLHEELLEEHSSLQAQHGEAKRDYQKLSASYAVLEDQLHATQASLNVAEEQLNESRRSNERLRGDVEREGEDAHRVAVLLAETSAELKQVRGELEDEREDRQGLESSFADISAELEEVSALKEELQLRVHDLEDKVEVLLAGTSKELKQVKGELEKEREEKQRVERSLADTSVELEEVRREKEEVQLRVHDLEETVTNVAEELSKAGTVAKELSREKEELQLRMHDLEEKVKTVTEELSIADKKANEASQRIEREVETSGVLHAEVSSLNSVKQALEEELADARSCILAMQSDLGTTRTTLTELELQLSDFLKERKSLSDVKSNLELELRRMSSTSSETAEKVEDELRMWRNKVEELADSLEKARMVAGSHEKRAWSLICELQILKNTLNSNSKWSKFFYPAAAVSGAAALAAGMTFFKYKHPSQGS